MPNPDPFPTDWTHKLIVTVDPDGPRDYNDRLVTAELTLLKAIARHAREIRVVVWETELETDAPDVLDTIQSQYDRVPAADRVWESRVGTEYRRELTDSTSGAVFDRLNGDHDPSWWLYDIKQVLMLTDADWLYHSTPDEVHVRNLNADAIRSDGENRSESILLDEVSKALEPIQGSCLFARTDAFAWEGNERTYELRPGRGSIDLIMIDSDGETHSFDLSRLSSITFDESERGATLSWHPSDKSGHFGSLARTFKRWIGNEPPTEIRFPDTQTAQSVAESIERLTTDCGLNVQVR